MYLHDFEDKEHSRRLKRETESLFGKNTVGKGVMDYFQRAHGTGLIANIGSQLVKRHFLLQDKNRPKSKPKGFAEEAHRHYTMAKRSYGFNKGDIGHYADWTHKKNFSDDRIHVHEQHHSGNWHISIRGTDPWGPISSAKTGGFSRTGKDFYIDSKILAGVTPGKFEHYKNRIKGIAAMHKILRPNGKLTMSGHSLGGSIVNHAMADPDIANSIHSAHSFNPGYSPLDGRNPKKHPSHLNVHEGSYDIMSAYNVQHGATKHFHDTGGINPKYNHDPDEWQSRQYWEGYDYEEQSYEPQAESESTSFDRDL